MTRRFAIALLASALAAAALLAVTSSVHAATDGKICPQFRHNGKTYRWSTAGSTLSCGTAKGWLLKLLDQKVRPATGNVPLHNGPRGYKCFGSTIDKAGHPIGGVCYTGTLAYPGSGFQWQGS